METRTTKSFVDLEPEERHEVVQRALASRIRFYEQQAAQRARRRERIRRLLGLFRLPSSRS